MVCKGILRFLLPIMVMNCVPVLTTTTTELPGPVLTKVVCNKIHEQFLRKIGFYSSRTYLPIELYLKVSELPSGPINSDLSRNIISALGLETQYLGNCVCEKAGNQIYIRPLISGDLDANKPMYQIYRTNEDTVLVDIKEERSLFKIRLKVRPKQKSVPYRLMRALFRLFVKAKPKTFPSLEEMYKSLEEYGVKDIMSANIIYLSDTGQELAFDIPEVSTFCDYSSARSALQTLQSELFRINIDKFM